MGSGNFRVRQAALFQLHWSLLVKLKMTEHTCQQVIYWPHFLSCLVMILLISRRSLLGIDISSSYGALCNDLFSSSFFELLLLEITIIFHPRSFNLSWEATRCSRNYLLNRSSCLSGPWNDNVPGLQIFGEASASTDNALYILLFNSLYIKGMSTYGFSSPLLAQQ